MRFTNIGSGERARHYVNMVINGIASTKTEGSSSNHTPIAQAARREVETYVIDNKMPGFTQQEHESMAQATIPRIIQDIVKGYFDREFPVETE